MARWGFVYNLYKSGYNYGAATNDNYTSKNKNKNKNKNKKTEAGEKVMLVQSNLF